MLFYRNDATTQRFRNECLFYRNDATTQRERDVTKRVYRNERNVLSRVDRKGHEGH